MHPDALWLGGPGGDSRCTANHAGYVGRSAHDTLALRLCWGSSHRCGQITMDLPGEPADVSGGRIRVSRQCSASAKHLWHHMPRDRGAHVRSGLGGAWRRQPMHGQPRWVRGRVRTRHAGSAGIPPTSSGQFAAPRPTEGGMIPAILQPLRVLVETHWQNSKVHMTIAGAGISRKGLGPARREYFHRWGLQTPGKLRAQGV